MLYLWDSHEGSNDGAHDEIDPKQPSKEGEIGSNSGTEVRFNLLDSKFPRNQPCLKIDQFSSAVLPFLQNMYNQVLS